MRKRRKSEREKMGAWLKAESNFVVFGTPVLVVAETLVTIESAIQTYLVGA